jgi:hypothetical protein
MFYAELTNGLLFIAPNTNEDAAISASLEKYGTTLKAIYKDVGNNGPFALVWEKVDTMRVREYSCIDNGYHAIVAPFYVASEFENPIIKGEDNWLSVWFCVCGPKDEPSLATAVEILSKRRSSHNKSFKKIKVSGDMLRIKGAVESLVRAIVVNQCEKHPELLPTQNRIFWKTGR